MSIRADPALPLMSNGIACGNRLQRFAAGFARGEFRILRETPEFSTKDRQELFARSRHRAFLPCQDFSCATRCKFFPSDRNRRAASFCARRNNRARPCETK